MSIPLDRLYHYIEHTAEKIYGSHVVIYRFWPHGSKNINDLNTLRTPESTWFDITTRPLLWCNDQEPLDFEYYAAHVRNKEGGLPDLLKSLSLYKPPENLDHNQNIFGKSILLHSEKRSRNLEKYQCCGRLVPVYYWSHAVIARDWFRYAQYENFEKKISKKRFLIYNRAWTGSREYRLKFSDLLIKHDLVDQCQTFCNPIEAQEHYHDHSFSDPVWRPDHVLENFFPPSLANSHSSADFNQEDYRSTEIEVVLETLFDDDRLHLTEKILRPIACRQPFILAATQGSLQYLRDYGFRTFGSVWDESYDTVKNPYDRLQAIINVMLTVCSWNQEQRRLKTQLIQEIVEHNQKHFFSQDFFDHVTDELKTNMREALDLITTDPAFDKWIDRWQTLLQISEIQTFMQNNTHKNHPSMNQYVRVREMIEQYRRPNH